MSSGAPAQLLANQQMRLVRSDGTIHSYMTLNASMAVMNYSRCNSLIPDEPAPPDTHYKVNLAQTIGGINLTLCSGGANGCIKGNDMRVL